MVELHAAVLVVNAATTGVAVVSTTSAVMTLLEAVCFISNRVNELC